ncbi:hypothetical protein F2P81_012465 [Scophthalmus maximus]|uniref:Ubiquinol-cytochrome c chaperone domain-containing protein n=1 Tax=Scophthalmus maximus TaxID=52904 RepID=A0A6A4SNC3_SCOMX|nr:hypothetical protein F2P81_012465 [Scophthalmus maximus]
MEKAALPCSCHDVIESLYSAREFTKQRRLKSPQGSHSRLVVDPLLDAVFPDNRAVMYRRPLQSAVRGLMNGAASRATHRKLCNVKETPQHTEEEVGAFTKLIEAIGFTGPLKYNKWKIKIAALRMYTCCVERINYDDFFDKCSLSDSLNSWFLVAQLHVWMCLVRMRQEGRAGKYMCRYIVHSMWEDVEQRSKIMGQFSRSERSRVPGESAWLRSLCPQSRASILSLWRNLFNRECEDPEQLELMVEYVRKQMQFIDALDGEDLLLTGEVKWRPLVEENAQSILKVARPTYNDAGLFIVLSFIFSPLEFTKFNPCLLLLLFVPPLLNDLSNQKSDSGGAA